MWVLMNYHLKCTQDEADAIAMGKYFSHNLKEKKKITWGEGVHVVEKGESMHDISQRYGIRLHSLYDLNDMPYDSKPEVGKLLKLR